MTKFNELEKLSTALVDEIASYNKKPTKASSARIRKITQQLNNIGPDLRRELIAADKSK